MRVELAHDDGLADWRAHSLAVGAGGLHLLTVLKILLARLWHIETLEAGAAQALRASEERLGLALEASAQGLYDLNVQTGQAEVNAQYALMLGYGPAKFHKTNVAWIERLHPDDVERVAGAYRD